MQYLGGQEEVGKYVVRLNRRGSFHFASAKEHGVLVCNEDVAIVAFDSHGIVGDVYRR